MPEPPTSRAAARRRTATSRASTRRLRDELLDGEIFYTLREAQIVIESWRRHYNAVRPHASLGYQPPAPEARRRCRMAGCAHPDRSAGHAPPLAPRSH